MRHILPIILLVAACVPTKSPRNENRAKRQMQRHFEAIKNIAQLHPDIIDSTTTVVKGELTIDEVKNSFTDTVYVDSLVMDSLLLQYSLLFREYDSIRSLDFRHELVIKDPELRDRIIELRRELSAARNKIVDTVGGNVGAFSYEDDHIIFKREIRGGVAYNSYIVKEQKKEYDQVKTEVKIDTKRVTLKDKILNGFFWGLFCIVFLLFVYYIIRQILK